MLRRLIGTRLRDARRVAHELVDELDDRGKLFALELAQEQQRLTRLVLVALAAVIVAILSIVWGAATLVAFAWDTPWRNHALIGLLAFWALLTLFLVLKLRALLASASQTFVLMRRIVAEDVERLRGLLKP